MFDSLRKVFNRASGRTVLKDRKYREDIFLLQTENKENMVILTVAGTYSQPPD